MATLNLKRALTLHEPWASVVALGLKSVENRTWRPPPGLLRPGEDLAIHSGKMEPDVGDWDFVVQTLKLSTLGQRSLVEMIERNRGKLIAVVRYERYVERADRLTKDEAKWFFGPIGWVVRHSRILTQPIAIRGQQGLWELPQQALDDVVAQLG